MNYMSSYLIYIIVSFVLVTLINCLCSDDYDPLFRDEIIQETGSDITTVDIEYREFEDEIKFSEDDIEYSDFKDDKKFSEDIV